jgi:hypothetical protein
MGNSRRGLWLWFAASGCLGVLVAFVLMALTARYAVSPIVILLLWPSSIVGIADPSTVSDKFLVALFEFGGNLILYGAIGTLIGLSYRRKSTSNEIGIR